ncbi:VOC family protein [Nitrososphaera viennensis]|uniref:VOC family protein n=2 Tax=Nitrososphaera viennensis TaxID=1034015 RepID=A0A977NMN9_9ARCH|nr:VOC family protein [Nitrososphaera viennensis]AIC14642.1 putative glyoxalase/bleomycin resistance protein/dioxygenase [Nitrososphaera viennensis EN76]UVS69606.1 VOC family protein [Nitrososphaera viennensis]
MTIMKVRKVIETSIYSRDLEPLKKFYSDVLGFEVIEEEKNKLVFLKAGASMLLAFNPDRTFPSNDKLPPHGAHGSTHFALEIEASDYEKWKECLAQNGIAIELEVNWKEARSLYFRDPAGNLVELMTPGGWPVDHY